MKLKQLVLMGSLVLSGCGTFVTPIATINGEWIYPYVEKKDGKIAAQGMVVTPKGIALNATRIFIDGGSRISPSPPDGIVDEVIVQAAVGRYVYTRTSYTGPDREVHNLIGDDVQTKELRERTLAILDNATQHYQGYRSMLRSIGKLPP